jgi:NADPH2:quinone reductase
VAHTGRSRDGYAERVVVGADGPGHDPGRGVGQQAAALVHDGVTGCALVNEQRVGAGDRVLVVGASGGLGIVLVQLARARGARVVALARDERKLARVRTLGADAVIDSAAPDWAGQARTALGGAGADVVFDNVGGDLGEAAFGLIAPGGRFSAHGTPGRPVRADRPGGAGGPRGDRARHPGRPAPSRRAASPHRAGAGRGRRR